MVHTSVSCAVTSDAEAYPETVYCAPEDVGENAGGDVLDYRESKIQEENCPRYALVLSMLLRTIFQQLWPYFSLCRLTKVISASTLSALALHLPIESILIPPSAYLRDRQLSPDIHVPFATGRRAFGAPQPFPKNFQGQSRLPRALRETTSFILLEENIKTEGIFRIPAHVKLREILREAYDRGQKFIAWKERQVALPWPKYDDAVGLDTTLAELDQTEAYGVHLAAGLVKSWYAELREPLFPPTCYKELKALFGNAEEQPSLEKLTDMLSYQSEWSILPLNSRKLLVRHLLPMLAMVVAHSEANKMTPDNVAVCFAPTLLCGPDQLEDMKVSSILRRVLSNAIELWPALSEVLGVDDASFARELQAPARIEDYEDPLNQGSSSEDVESPGFHEEQKVGIILKDNEGVMGPPPLPPRQPIARGTKTSTASTGSSQSEASEGPSSIPQQSWPNDSKTGSGSEDMNIRRKPAPPLMVPPRYSTVAASAEDVTESPSTYTAVADGFAPPRRSDWSFDTQESSPINMSATGLPMRTESQIRRKPVSPATPIGGDDLEKR
jgi:Rho GTPase-activating protein 1